MFRNRFPLIFIFAACLFLSFSPLFSQAAHAESVSADSESISAQSEPVSAQPVITEIKITGLKKTKPAYMQQVLEKYKGVPITQIDLDEVETTLQAEGLFSESEAEITRNENGELILSVTVTEKISFIPLPFLSYSSSTGFMGGLMLMDTNAFGVKDQYIVGGIFSGSMQMGVMSFSKPSLSRTKPGFSINGSFMHRDNTFQDTDEKTFLEYENIGASATFSITDKITEHASVKSVANSKSAKVTFSSRPTFFSISLARALASSGVHFFSCTGARVILSMTFILLKRLKCWKTMPIFSRT